MLSFRAAQPSIQQPNVLPAIVSVCVCFLFLSLNFLLVKGRHRNARSQIPLAAMTQTMKPVAQWQMTTNLRVCVCVCVIPLLTIFTLKALPEKTMNLLSHPTIKDVHHYRIVSMRSLVPQNLQQKKPPTSGGVDHPIPEASKFTKFLRHIQHKI